MGRRLLLLLIATSAAAATTAQWLPDERRGLDDAMTVGNLRAADLRYPRRVVPAARTMPAVERAIDDPMESVNEVMAWHAGALRRSLAQLILLSGEGVEPLPETPDLAAMRSTPIVGLPPDVEPPIRRLVVAVAAANAEVRAALTALEPEDRRALIEGLPTLALEEPSIRLDFVRGTTLSRDRLFGLADRVDGKRIRAAAARLADVAQREAAALKGTSGDLIEPLRTRVGGVALVVGGRGPDRHADTDAMVTVDLGGDDVYTGRNGAGIGFASVLLDLGGDDRHRSADLGAGTGLLGIGLLRDEAGDDDYASESLAFGCGILGVGAMVDATGDDRYRSTALAQGFGFWGEGLLIDNEGDDRYDVQLYGQGAARTSGWGWLVDRAGRDVYRAGGRILNSPLFADVHYSFAQGYGSGYREDAGGEGGGVGLLTDGGGNDAYLAETYAQAASYWYGLGSLYDVAGHDVFRAYHYAQASAMHACASMLFDLTGDDAYLTQFGASLAIGHDYGVAVLLDRAGNDLYVARDSTPGIGNANGVGIFLDGAGEDRYQGPPGRANPARGTHSVGVFADLGGPDRYFAGLADGQAFAGDRWAAALDQEDPPRPAARVDDPAPAAARRTPGSLPNPGPGELARLYQTATRWGVGTAQASVEDALDRLVGIGLPAYEWMLAERLAGADRLQLRAFFRLASALGEAAHAPTLAALADRDERRVRNALAIVADARIAAAGPSLAALLARGTATAAVARTAGAVGAEECVPKLMVLAGSGDPAVAGIAAVALAQIGDESAFSTMQILVASPQLPVRQAAIDLMARFPLRGREVGQELVRSPETRLRRLGLELLAKIGTPEALGDLADRLTDPEPEVRISALQGLAGRCPADAIADFLRLREDPVPLVRAVARRLSPER